jgi:hypothetical protein
MAQKSSENFVVVIFILGLPCILLNRYFSKLLKNSKDHIRRFAAESFAFLMRKV